MWHHFMTLTTMSLITLITDLLPLPLQRCLSFHELLYQLLQRVHFGSLLLCTLFCLLCS